MSDPMLPAGTGRCKCMACGRYFSVPRNFDKHQRQDKDGRNICVDPVTVGLVLSESGYWQGPGMPDGHFAASRHAMEGAKTTHTKGSDDSASFGRYVAASLFDGEVPRDA